MSIMSHSDLFLHCEFSWQICLPRVLLGDAAGAFSALPLRACLSQHWSEGQDTKQKFHYDAHATYNHTKISNPIFSVFHNFLTILLQSLLLESYVFQFDSYDSIQCFTHSIQIYEVNLKVPEL